jgi:hypothetical protein
LWTRNEEHFVPDVWSEKVEESINGRYYQFLFSF